MALVSCHICKKYNKSKEHVQSMPVLYYHWFLHTDMACQATNRNITQSEQSYSQLKSNSQSNFNNRWHCHSLLSPLWVGWCLWLDLSSFTKSKKGLERDSNQGYLCWLQLHNYTARRLMYQRVVHSSTGLGLPVWLVLCCTSLLWSMQCCGDCPVSSLDLWYVLPNI